MTRALLVTSIIAPYRIPVFNRLAEEAGIELQVAYLAETVAPRRWVVDRDEIEHSYVVLGEATRLRYGDTYLHLTRGLVPLLHQFRPDVVIAGGWDQPAYLMAAAIRRLRRHQTFRLLCFVESTDLDDRRGGRFAKALKTAMIKTLDGVIVPGTASAEYSQRLGAPRSAIYVAPNSVDSDFWAAPDSSAAPGKEKVRFICAGQLIPRKGVAVLIDAWSGMPDWCELVIVGDGPLRGELERAAGPTVTFRGQQQREQLRCEYRNAQVFVFPSLSDPWGLVINEAMCAGLPVVTTSAPGGARDLVVDGVTGQVVPPGSAESLRAAMMNLALDAGLRIDMARNARRHISGFTPEIQAAGLARAIRTTSDVQAPP